MQHWLCFPCTYSRHATMQITHGDPSQMVSLRQFFRSSGKVLNLKIVKLRAHKSPDQFRISLLTRTRPVFLHPCSTSAALTYSTHHGNLKNSPELKKTFAAITKEHLNHPTNQFLYNHDFAVIQVLTF
jgi:hypothetical protein